MVTTTISKSQPSITTRSHPYQLLGWLNTAPETNKVTRNSQFTIFGLIPPIMQTSSIHWMVFWCLPITFFCGLYELLFLYKWTHYIVDLSLRLSTYSCKKFNYMITTLRSKYQPPKTTSSRPYHSLGWINTSPEMNKVTRNSQFTRVFLPPSMLQTSFIDQTIFWCLPLTLFLVWSRMSELDIF